VFPRTEFWKFDTLQTVEGVKKGPDTTNYHLEKQKNSLKQFRSKIDTIPKMDIKLVYLSPITE
jgi:hypothetical protein